MKKISLLLCLIVLSACNTSSNNVPVAAIENSQVVPVVPELEVPVAPEIKDEEEIEKPKFDLSLLTANDVLPIESEKCTLSKHPLISFKRSYDKTSFKYLGNKDFDFNLQTYMDPMSGEEFNSNYTLGMKLGSEIKDDAFFTIFNREEYVTYDIYFDLLVMGSWKMKELTDKKMILTANVFGDQCDYTFTVPSIHDTDGDGVNNNLDCAPEDQTRSSFREYFVDSDFDGYGSEETIKICAGQATSTPDGYAEESGDCDDHNSNKAFELFLLPDVDGDGVPNGDNQLGDTVCYDVTAPTYPNYTEDFGEYDCDDNNANINPWSDEISGDGIDNNCDGIVEEDEPIEESPMPIADNNNQCNPADWFANGISLTPGCQSPFAGMGVDTDEDSVPDSYDCAPNDSNLFRMVVLYRDNDLDGEGDPTWTNSSCQGYAVNLSRDWSTTSRDCDDSDSRIYPGAYEAEGSSRDLNCDGIIN